MENIEFNIALDEIDDHFTEKLNENLNKIREQLQLQSSYEPWSKNIHRSSDSPVTMSSNGDCDDNITMKTTEIQMTKLNVFDSLNVYFRCQKYMYSQSSKNTMHEHTCISGITIFISSGICIFISFLENNQWKTIIVVVLNAIVSILLLLSKYWKLETTATLYSYISRQFEIISENIEHVQTSNHYVSIPYQIQTKVRELEKRVTETRDIPNITVPTYIQVLYPVSSNINMFSFIKKVDSRIAYLNDELHNINMEMNYIVKKYCNNMGPRETNRMQFLLNKKTTNKNDLKYAENAYAYLEEIFTREINKAEYYSNNYLYRYFLKPPQFSIDYSRCNPFVDEYISFILPKKNV